MPRLRLIPIALAAVAVPVLLALGVHFAAGSSLTAPPAVVARVSTAPIATPSVEPARTTTTSGRCAEREHRDEPRCSAGGSGGSDDNSGSNSGKGRSGSGRSGDDD